MSDASMELAELIQFEQHNIALLLCDYLNSESITAKVRIDNATESPKYSVLCAPEQWEGAKAVCEEFIQQPYHPKYQQAAWHTNKTTNVNASNRFAQQGFIPQFLKHAGVVTLTIFSVCWLVYIASVAGWWREVFSALQFYSTVSVPTLIEQPYRLIGPALFHFSLLHIAFNTMWWWQLGGSVEQVLGKRTLLILFLFSALLSNVGQYLVSGPNFGGLSGVVYALVGFVWWYGWLAPNKGLMLSKGIVGFMLFWLALGFVDLLPVAVANTAHLLGLLSGCFMAWLFSRQDTEQEKASQENK